MEPNSSYPEIHTAAAVLQMGMKGRVCDIGCGPMVVARYLALQATRYVAIDIDPMPPLRGVEFHQTEDMHLLTLPEQFDFMFAMSLLIHLDEFHLDACFDFVHRHLAPDGVFMAYYWEGLRARLEDWKRFPFWQRPLSDYRAVGQQHGLMVTDAGCYLDYGGSVRARPSWSDSYIRKHARVLKGTLE